MLKFLAQLFTLGFFTITLILTVLSTQWVVHYGPEWAIFIDSAGNKILAPGVLAAYIIFAIAQLMFLVLISCKIEESKCV